MRTAWIILVLMLQVMVGVRTSGELGQNTDKADKSDKVDKSDKEKSTHRLDSLAQILLESEDVDLQKDILRGMTEGLAGRGSVRAPSAWASVFRKLATSKDAEVRDKVLVLSVLFGDRDALAHLRKIVGDPKGDVERRSAALTTLTEKRDPQLVPVLRDLLDEKGMSQPALRGLAAFADPQIPAWVLARYERFTAAEKAEALATLAARPAFAGVLLDALANKQIPPRDLSAYTARQIANLGDTKLTLRLEQVWGNIRSSDKEKQAQLAKYLKMVRPDTLKNADRSQGRAVFVRVCAQCHVLFGEGNRIGPDLTGAQRTNPEYILGELLDPSAVVAKDYQLTLIDTRNGRNISGVILEENDKVLSLQTPTAVVRINKGDIASRTMSKQSLMPEGMLSTLKNPEIRDLIAYLAGAGQVPLPGKKE